MKLLLNPFALVIKNGGHCQFLGEGNATLTLGLNVERQKCVDDLVSGEAVEREYLCGVFSPETVDAMVNNQILLENLPDTESIRSRTDAFFKTFNMPEARERLNQKKVLILGCGGIGTHMAWHMTTLGVGEITLLDYDAVEQSNLNRQILFTQNDVGDDKIEVLRSKLLGISPDANIKLIRARIQSEKQLEEICCGEHYDLIIKALDSPSDFPKWLDNVCKRNKLSYVAGITMREQALIGPSFVPGVSEIGWSDLLGASAQGEKIHGTAPSLGVMLYRISDELAVEAFKILTGYGKLKYSGRIAFENLFTNEIKYVGGVSESQSIATNSSGTPRKELPLAISIVILTTLGGMINPWVYIVAFALAMMLPFYLYRTRTQVVKYTFINATLFSMLTIVGVARGGLLSTFVSSPLELIASIAVLFGVLSILVLGMCLINAIIARIAKKQA